MPRFRLIEPQQAGPFVRGLLESVHKTSGRLPNSHKAMAISRSTLEAFVRFEEALSRGVLSARLRKQIGIFVSQTHNCEYGLAQHRAAGRKLGISAEEIALNRLAQSSDEKTCVALTFAAAITQNSGHVSDAALQEISDAGFSDEAIAEIVATVALATFSDLFNLVARTPLDFPRLTRAVGRSPSTEQPRNDSRRPHTGKRRDNDEDNN